MNERRRMRAVAVCGTGSPDIEAMALAEELGHLIVARGCVLVCGGMGGVMEAACRGGAAARDEGGAGIVLGVLPGGDLDGGNPHCQLVLPTGMGVARNVLVVRAADAVILVGGGAGTLSEAAYAWQFGKPVVALACSGGWAARLAGRAIDDRRPDQVISATSPREALDAAFSGLET
jgi:uncharacterized protein (TIGR00725 family)